MAERLDHKCIICGTLYHACDTCQKVKTYTPWRTLCDTQEHYQVLLALKSFESGILTREEAAADIRKRGVTKGTYSNWPEGTKRKLDEIFIEPKRKKVASDPIMVQTTSVEVPSETVEEIETKTEY